MAEQIEQNPDEQWEEMVCECEMDWRCGLHAGLPTYLETRYSDCDVPDWAK